MTKIKSLNKNDDAKIIKVWKRYDITNYSNLQVSSSKWGVCGVSNLKRNFFSINTFTDPKKC